MMQPRKLDSASEYEPYIPDWWREERAREKSLAELKLIKEQLKANEAHRKTNARIDTAGRAIGRVLRVIGVALVVLLAIVIGIGAAALRGSRPTRRRW